MTNHSYQAATGRVYQYRLLTRDRDLDHPRAALFTFEVQGPERTFEKVIAVEPREIPLGVVDRLAMAERVAEAHLQTKLDQGNEADEPTPLA